MAFIGNSNTTQGFTPAIDYFNGNGSTTAFTLSRPVASVAQVQVVIENVPQNPGSAYTVSGNTITFTSAPPSGTSNIYVYYTSPITQVIAPGQGTVNTTALGNITNIASGNSSLTLQTGTTPTTAMTINTSQNVGIGTSSPAAKLDIVGGSNILGLTNTLASGYEAINMTVGTQQARIVLTGQSFGDANYGTGDLTIQAQTVGKGIRFGTNGGTNQMIIDSSGNVGIGTSSPGSKLTVAGSSSLGTASSSGNTSIYQSPGSLYLTLNTNGTLGGSRRNWAISPEYDVAGGLSFTVGTSEGASPTSTKMVLDSSGNLLFNSGYGSVATAYGCRAWVNFNGTGTVAIRASGNVTSITDNGTGQYTVNFTNSMPDVNYSTVVSADAASGLFGTIRSSATYLTGSVGINTYNGSIATADHAIVCVSVFR